MLRVVQKDLLRFNEPYRVVNTLVERCAPRFYLGCVDVDGGGGEETGGGGGGDGVG